MQRRRKQIVIIEEFTIQDLLKNINTNMLIFDKLQEIKENVTPWSSSIRVSRREEVVLCRLHIRHSSLTHPYIITQQENFRALCVMQHLPSNKYWQSARDGISSTSHMIWTNYWQKIAYIHTISSHTLDKSISTVIYKETIQRKLKKFRN